MEAMKINKITWVAKQLQHKTNMETLTLSSANDGYVLSMEGIFVLDSYIAANPVSCIVSPDSAGLYFAPIEQGNHYRLQANGQVVFFRIMTRKIWFFDSEEAMVADAIKKDRALITGK